MKRILRFFLPWLLLVVAALLFIAFFPIMHRPFRAPVRPRAHRMSRRFEEIRAEYRRDPRLRPPPRKAVPSCWIMASPTEYVFVFLHGLSELPRPVYSARPAASTSARHNVYIPACPTTGEEDRLTTDWARLTAAGHA